MAKTGPSAATRKRVFDRDRGECQFWHSEPFPATQFSHYIHQGAGGLPPSHELNQPKNGAASCDECHLRFPPNGRYRWEKFRPVKLWALAVAGKPGSRGTMEIRAPNGQLVPPWDLWSYNRWRWRDTERKFLELEEWIAREYDAAWRVAEIIRWLKEEGISHAVSGAEDYLDIAAAVGIASANAKKRNRVAGFKRELSGLGRHALSRVSLDVADRLRKIPDSELITVAAWFADLPPAEAWSRFDEKYPGPEKMKTYRVVPHGGYREIKAETEERMRDMIQELPGEPGEALIFKGGSVIQGVRKEIEEDER